MGPPLASPPWWKTVTSCVNLMKRSSQTWCSLNGRGRQHGAIVRWKENRRVRGANGHSIPARVVRVPGNGLRGPEFGRPRCLLPRMGRSEIRPAHPITGRGNQCVLARTVIAGEFVIVVGIDAGELIAECDGVFAPRGRGHQTLQQQAKLKLSRPAYRGVGQGPLVALQRSTHS